MKSMDMQYPIREYGESDTDGILALFSASFHKEVSGDWFRWKYQCSPWGSKGYVVKDGEEVVAFYGGIRMPFHFRGKTLWAYQFCDVMTHPRFRGRLISKGPLIVRAGEVFYRESPMDFAFGFPSLRHARLQSLRLGGEGYRLVRLYRKEAIGKRAWLGRLRIREGWESLKEGELDRLLARHDDGSLRFLKDERYLGWRYRENPSKRYRLLVLQGLSRTRGYLVFSVEDGWFNVLEIFYREAKDLKNILSSAEAYAAGHFDALKGVRAWFHPAEPVAKYLQASGYEGEEHIPIAFRSVNKECGVDAEVFYENYFYRMGDYDAS